MKTNPVNWIEINQPDCTPIIISIARIESITFRAKVAGGNDDGVLINLIDGKSLPVKSPRAEDLYCRLKALLKPEVLEC